MDFSSIEKINEHADKLLNEAMLQTKFTNIFGPNVIKNLDKAFEHVSAFKIGIDIGSFRELMYPESISLWHVNLYLLILQGATAKELEISIKELHDFLRDEVEPLVKSYHEMASQVQQKIQEKVNTQLSLVGVNGNSGRTLPLHKKPR